MRAFGSTFHPWVFIALLACIGVFWLAGEKHRENCLAQGHTSCGTLPWEVGVTPTPEAITTAAPMTRYQRLRAAQQAEMDKALRRRAALLRREQCGITVTC